MRCRSFAIPATYTIICVIDIECIGHKAMVLPEHFLFSSTFDQLSNLLKRPCTAYLYSRDPFTFRREQKGRQREMSDSTPILIGKHGAYRKLHRYNSATNGIRCRSTLRLTFGSTVNGLNGCWSTGVSGELTDVFSVSHSCFVSLTWALDDMVGYKEVCSWLRK